ncbi:MAG TPA: hypothetical protein VFF02_17405 [Anaeromyxobacteraceae bacterium]|nr:hypothetical protein [Anaeromyxobacteraceae bacterium]
MKTSLWIVVVMIAGFVGFLIGYSVSSHTGTRGLETIVATSQKPAAPAAAPAGGYAEKPTAPTSGYGEKPAAPTPAATPQSKPSAQASSAGATPEKPAPPKQAAPRAAPSKAGSSTAGY